MSPHSATDRGDMNRLDPTQPSQSQEQQASGWHRYNLLDLRFAGLVVAVIGLIVWLSWYHKHTYFVEAVRDGDTLVVSKWGRKFLVQLAGADAPEIHKNEPFAGAARIYLVNRVLGRKIWLDDLDTSRKLDYDRFQLALAIAEQALQRARTTLSDKKVERAGVVPVTEMSIAKAETEWRRLRDAIAQTRIYADRDGLVIYGENPFTGSKIFPGVMLQTTVKIAEVASRKKLQFHFWVHEADILKLPVGARMVIAPDAMPGRSVTATVDWTSKQATTREEWSKGGYFEMRAVPVEAVPKDFIPGMAVMSELL